MDRYDLRRGNSHIKFFFYFTGYVYIFRNMFVYLVLESCIQYFYLFIKFFLEIRSFYHFCVAEKIVWCQILAL